MLLLALAQSPPGRRLLLGRVTAFLASRHVDLQADDVRYNLFTLAIDARNVRVRSGISGDLPVFATIGRAELDLSLADLVRGSYRLESGTVRGLDLHYVVDGNGRDNLPRLSTDAAGPQRPIDYSIARLSFPNARVRYTNVRQQLDVDLSLSSLDVVAAAVTRRHQIRFATASGQVRVRNEAVTVDRLAGLLDAGRDDLRIDGLQAQMAGSQLELAGVVSGFDAPELALKVQTRIDAAQAASVLDLRDPIKGTISVDITATGRLSAPIVDARVSSSEMRFRSLGGARLEAQAVYDGATRRVDVPSAGLLASWGRLAATATVSIDRERRSRLHAELTAGQVATIMRGLDLQYVADARAGGNLDAEWPGLEYAEGSIRGFAALASANPRATARSIPLSGRLAIGGTRRTIVADLQRITAAGADITGRLHVQDLRDLQGELRATVTDIASTVGDAERFLGRPAQSLLPAPVTGMAAIVARVGGTIEAPTARATVTAPSLSIGGEKDIVASGELAFTPSILTIARAEAKSGTAHADVSGTLGLSGQQSLDLVVNAGAADVQTLVRATGMRAPPVSGRLSARGTIRGTLARPLASLTLDGGDLVAFNESFGSVSADVALTGRDIRLSRLVVEKPQPGGPGRLDATGSYNLDREQYTLDLRSQNLQLLTLTLPTGARLRGRVQLAGAGTGTVRSPAGTLDIAIDALEVAGLPLPWRDSTVPAPPPAQLGRITIAAIAANNQVTVTTTADRFTLAATAVVGLSRPWPTTVTVRTNDLDLEQLPLGLQTRLTGQLRAVVNAAGDLAQPERGRLTASIEALAGAWNGQAFALAEQTELGYEQQRLAIKRLHLRAPQSSIVVAGEVPLNRSAGDGDLAIEAQASLASVARFLPEDLKVTAGGGLTVAGSLRGTLQSMSPDLTITLDDGVLSAPRAGADVSAIRLRARVADGVARIEQLTGTWSKATIEAAATLPLELLPPLPVGIERRSGPATLKASVRDLDPAAVPHAPAGLTGRVSVDIDAAASGADLTTLEGFIAFPQLEVTYNRFRLAQQEPSRIDIRGGAATVERLVLSGSGGAVAASGTVGLGGDRPVDMKVNGTLNLAALSGLAKSVRTDGTATWDVAATGTVTSPALHGAVDLADATVAVDALNIAAENVAAHLNLAGTRVELTKLSGEVNGGGLDGSGAMTLGAGTIADLDLRLSAKDFAYDAPLGLRSLSNSSIQIKRRGDEFLVDGQVTIDEAGLTTDINFEDDFFADLRAPRTRELMEPRNPLLERVRFAINVDTATPVMIDNNLARAEIDANLRIVGTPYEPGLTGRLTVAEGGLVTLNARRYEVERGVITFVDDRRIVPSGDLVLNTKASNYDVRITVTGTAGQTETTWTSEPPLPEPDIMALVVTGRTVDEMRGEESEVAKVQALTYLTGRVGGKFGRGLERATGISEVRIEPVLIANETDPTARLTVGQNITDQVKLVYSTNLADSNDQIWVVEYDVTRRFELRGVREREDDSYRGDFRHDLRFGGDPAPRRELRHRPTIASLTIVSDAGLDEATARSLFKLKPGDNYDFFAARSGLERIEKRLLESGYLQSRVRVERQVDKNTASLTLRITSGPLVVIRFDGLTPPSKIQQRVRTAWHRGVFDRQRGNDSVGALREWLLLDKYLQPDLQYDLQESGDGRVVVFRIRAGPRYDRVVLAVEGASAIHPDQVEKIIEEQRLEIQLFTDPAAVTGVVQRFFREQGYLSAEIDAPRYEFQGTNARVVLPVREGPRFQVRHVTTAGNTVYTSKEISDNLPIASGGAFVAAAAAHAQDGFRQLYWRKGYNDVSSEYSLAVDRSAASVDVAFAIQEGRQSVVADIAVEGNRRTSERLVRGQIELSPAEPLDLSVLARSRRNLYSTGAFALADIIREDVEAQPAGASVAPAAPQTPQEDGQKPVRLTVSVREVQPVRLRYGLSYDTEGGLGGILDFSVHNALGKARIIGAQGRYDSEIHEARVYFSQPALRTWPRKTTASVYFREDLEPPTEQTDPFDISRQGASVQQEVQFRKAYIWSYGYRYELATTLEPSLGPGATETVRITPLSSTLTRETRDEVLDASKGTFVSQAFAYSPNWLGSDRPYLKYYGQYFHYFPLTPARPKPFSHELLRPRLVFATGARIGLAQGLGGDVPTSERFYAGGSTTLRGFEQNAVGPIGVNNIPAGGNAVLVLNNELRTPLFGILDGVVFVDVGNVYPTIKDLSFTDLRQSAGIGIRLRTPWILLRSDYGFVLDPRAGESRSRFYFSIGQAF